mmetsp:Transcript_72300/g.215754  ORF Transcript_72300/g.215754 Transcript_72300/m.215754 type:complete len:230 (-) Transcript_72300:932-1621(-)
MHVEDLLVLHELHAADVGGEGLLGQVPDGAVAREKTAQLALDCDQFRGLRADVLHVHSRCTQLLRELLLGGQEKQGGVPGALVACRTPDAVDVGLHGVRAVHLHDPINHREVHAARGDVRADERRGALALRELLEDDQALREALPPVQLHHEQPRLQQPEGLVDEADLLAGRHKDYDLLGGVRPQEGEKHVHLLLQGNHHAHLLQPVGRPALGVPVHTDDLRRTECRSA